MFQAEIWVRRPGVKGKLYGENILVERKGDLEEAKPSKVKRPEMGVQKCLVRIRRTVETCCALVVAEKLDLYAEPLGHSGLG